MCKAKKLHVFFFGGKGKSKLVGWFVGLFVCFFLSFLVRLLFGLLVGLFVSFLVGLLFGLFVAWFVVVPVAEPTCVLFQSMCDLSKKVAFLSAKLGSKSMVKI